MFHDPFKLCIILWSVSQIKENLVMNNKELCYMLELDPDTVENMNITRKDEKYEFRITMKKQTYECPECHSSHVNIKSNKTKKLTGSQFNNNTAIVFIIFLIIGFSAFLISFKNLIIITHTNSDLHYSSYFVYLSS